VPGVAGYEPPDPVFISLLNCEKDIADVPVGIGILLL
jgi:hypothetical protein